MVPLLTMEKVVEKEVKQTRPISAEAMLLLEWIGKRKKAVADFLLESYDSGTDNLDPIMLEETIDFLTQNSAITATVLASPGSSVISELLYDQKTIVSLIDEYFYKSKGGKAVKGRLEVMERQLPIVAEKYLQKQNTVAIASLGSGPGRYIIDSVSRLKGNGHVNGSVKATCFDIDENAIMRGKRLAAMNGVDDCVKYKRADIFRNVVKFYEKKFDVVVLKGILCPYDAKGCRTVLEHTKTMLKPGGTLIASNVSKKMVEEDPFTCFIMGRIANWVMQYKSEAELRDIFEKSGLGWKGSFTDSLGFHIMGVGEVN